MQVQVELLRADQALAAAGKNRRDGRRGRLVNVPEIEIEIEIELELATTDICTAVHVPCTGC